jgi:hypothetical protein
MKKLGFLLFIMAALSGCATKPNFVFLEKVAVDQNTGITWARNANMPGKQLIWRGDDNVYEYIKRLNETNYAGYGDWRVPSKGEFEKMIEYAKVLGYNEAQMETWPYQRLRQLGFIDVRDYDYWTSSRQSATEMFTVDMNTGRIKPKPESRPYFLWPVRGIER